MPGGEHNSVPVFRLNRDLAFPPPELAEDNGLLAMGGDLSSERLLLAYSMGIFPWYSEGDPLLWWSPSPRLVLFPDEFHCSRRLARTLRNGRFTVTADSAFPEVIAACASTRRARESGTWITPEMRSAYVRLHRQGFAHSVEAWRDGELAGGLYGIRLGRVFFGESMFTRITDGSKVAFASLIELCRRFGVGLIDCQMTTSHLLRFGAREIEGAEFQELLRDLADSREPDGPWRNLLDPAGPRSWSGETG